MQEEYIGYIDNEETNFQTYTKRLKRKGILLKCRNGNISKEQVVEWLVQNEIKCFLVDYRLKPEFSYEGTDLLFYLRRILPDLPCIILTNYTEDSLKDNLVEDYLIFDRAILDKIGTDFDTFIESLKKCIQVFNQRMQLRIRRYEQLCILKKEAELNEKEYEEFLSHFNLLKSYGYIDDIPTELLDSEVENKIDRLLESVDKLLQEKKG
ncbi:hypothetical protein A5800_001218 [Enterococcus sp. 5B7_DIV0075]|uniref:hypothetical protein n=1 Tax=Enterococcus sp. 5B7_DIV0075 TaxID=1987386 RepID=UPI000A33DD99|nr:hypothetical protein [Enterococcus sp. 5B7_DIV0075]OTP23370.1 hypothetical protein A5800_001218 [Enterococcus sp. 5B7_DIV0075]